ncbi:PilZ domain-containing protein [Roseateles sp.]|uniref:PilZ domain-containing protein n=1 Tax=Roseateles sp. TaxID=1971397 RepID=UPI002F3E8E6B
MFRLRLRPKPPAAEAAPAAAPAEAAVIADADVIDAAAPATEDTEDADGDERRTTPRRDVPLGPAVRVEFMLLGRARSLNVDDVSLGGLGLRGSVEEGRGLFLGQKVPQARVMVGDQLVLVADLEVRIRRSFRSFLAGEQVHIGCRFLGLNPLAEAELQRLLAQLIGQRGR